MTVKICEQDEFAEEAYREQKNNKLKSENEMELSIFVIIWPQNFFDRDRYGKLVNDRKLGVKRGENVRLRSFKTLRIVSLRMAQTVRLNGYLGGIKLNGQHLFWLGMHLIGSTIMPCGGWRVVGRDRADEGNRFPEGVVGC